MCFTGHEDVLASGTSPSVRPRTDAGRPRADGSAGPGVGASFGRPDRAPDHDCRQTFCRLMICPGGHSEETGRARERLGGEKNRTAGSCPFACRDLTATWGRVPSGPEGLSRRELTVRTNVPHGNELLGPSNRRPLSSGRLTRLIGTGSCPVRTLWKPRRPPGLTQPARAPVWSRFRWPPVFLVAWKALLSRCGFHGAPPAGSRHVAGRVSGRRAGVPAAWRGSRLFPVRR